MTEYDDRQALRELRARLFGNTDTDTDPTAGNHVPGEGSNPDPAPPTQEQTNLAWLRRRLGWDENAATQHHETHN